MSLRYRRGLRVGWWAVVAAVLLLGCAGCGTREVADREVRSGAESSEGLRVVTDVSFLADIAQFVAGERATVSSVIPKGVDPHSFQATPSDARLIASAQLVVLNVRGLEPSLEKLIEGMVGKDVPVVEAAEGVEGRAQDPHVWLDPTNVVTYVKNIASALAQIDAQGATLFAENAEEYARLLEELDLWIQEQVKTIPEARRLLVTNHESLGYFARRYGFKVVGTIFPSTSGEGSPSARQVSELVEAIKRSGAPAVFLETGSNDHLAQRVAAETGVAVVADLCLHSLSDQAPTYLDMMRWNVTRIVEALR